MPKRIFTAVSCIFIALCSTITNAQWTKEAGIEAQYIESLFVYEDKIYAGSENLIHIKTARNGSWEKSGVLPVDPGAGVSCIYRTGNRLFAGTYGHGIFESIDDGNTWMQRNNGINTSYQITAFVQRDNILYAGTSGNAVFAMDLNSAAAVWMPFRNGLPFNTGAWDVNSLHNYAGTLISAAGQSGYIYFNESVNDPWYDREFGGPGQSGLAMWALTDADNVLLGAASTGFYRSTDNGVTWEYFNPVLGSLDNGKFAAKGNKVFAALTRSTYGTLIYSTVNAGINWVHEDNMPGILAFDFAVFGDHFYIAAFDGLWYKPLNPSSVDDDNAVQDFILYQNYPNPFNPTTNITYSVPSSGLINLKVFDVLGNEVATLVNEEKPAGTYEIYYNASDLPSGVYVYQLRATPGIGQAGGFIQTKKMVVVK